MNIAVPNFADAPFHVAPDVVIDLPVPPSVNRTRKIDWRHKKKVDAWKRDCDAHILAEKREKINPLKLTCIPRFELTIRLSEDHTGMDLDAGLKALIDYLRRIQIIENDAQKNMRKLTVEWGHAPLGCRVEVRACA